LAELKTGEKPAAIINVPQRNICKAFVGRHAPCRNLDRLGPGPERDYPAMRFGPIFAPLADPAAIG
jgi:hypothetical protein